MKIMKSLRDFIIGFAFREKDKKITQPGSKFSISRHDDSRRLRNKKPGSAGGCEFGQLSCDPDRFKKSGILSNAGFFLAGYFDLPE